METYESRCSGVPSGTGFVEVQDGTGWACAEDQDRLLHCWGQQNLASKVTNKEVVDWSIELDVGCAVLDDASVTCWGMTDLWEMGGPEALLGPPADLKYTQVAVGRDHACALDTAGEAHCWGSTQVSTVFPEAPPGPWESIFAQNFRACGMRADGTVECWYDLGTLVEPGDWVIPDEKWTQIGLGEWSACGLTLDGRGVCFPSDFDHAGEQDIPDLADL